MDYSANSHEKLFDIIDVRIASLIREMEEANWRTEDIVIAIDAVMRSRWMERLEALREAREATPKDFVSDGNEG